MEDMVSGGRMSGHRYGDIVINDGTSHFGDVHNFVQKIGISPEEQRRNQVLSSLRFPKLNSRWNDITDSEFARYQWFFHDKRDRYDDQGEEEEEIGNKDRAGSQDNNDGGDNENPDGDGGGDDQIYHTFEEGITRNWPSLKTWLQQPYSAYLVQGKPGSGKSTFMKFMSQHRIISTLLQQWAEPKHARVMFHSFWLVGTKLQHSMRGFLASLMYRMAEEEESIADIVYQTYPNKYHLNDWSEKELSSLLLSSLRASQFYYCIFIDGLDEFDANDDPDRISDVLHEILGLNNCKLCLSTRPISHILDRWQDHFILKLHELNYEDISRHVVSVLKRKSYRIATSEKQEHLVRDLAKTICDKAEGVFLWVHYVLKTLCSGIRARDDLVSLKKRVALLPSEISDLYRTIWEKQNLDNEIHAQESAVCFQLVLKYPGQPLLKAAMRLDPMLINEYAERMESFGKERIETILSHYAELLHTRSAGLIECRTTYLFTDEMRECYAYDKFLRAEYQVFNGLKKFAQDITEVEFIHRSVHDFLTETTFGRSLANLTSWCDPLATPFNNYICHLAGIIERYTTATRYQDSDQVYGLLQIDERHIDLIDSVYKDLVGTLAPIESSNHDWAFRLVQLGNRDVGYALDFPGIIMQTCPSERVVRYLLESRGKSWSRYYMGHLVAQVVHRRYDDLNVLYHPIQELVERGADLMSLQIFAQDHGVFFVRSPAVEILSWLFGLMYRCPDKHSHTKEQILLPQAHLHYWLALIDDQLDTSTRFSMFLSPSCDRLSWTAESHILNIVWILVFDTWETYHLLSSMVSSMGSGSWTLQDRSRLRVQSETILKSVYVVDAAWPKPSQEDYFKIYKLDHTLFEKFRKLSSQWTSKTWQAFPQSDGFSQIHDAALANPSIEDMSDAQDVVLGCIGTLEWIPISTDHIHKPQKSCDAWKPCRRNLWGDTTPWQERMIFTPTDEEKQRIEYVNKGMQRRLDLTSGPVKQNTAQEREIFIRRPWEPRVNTKLYLGQALSLILSRTNSSDRSVSTGRTNIDDEDLLDEVD